MRDYCKYVNVFQGCGEIDLPKPEGIAARWFFIKAGCGNTSNVSSDDCGKRNYYDGYTTSETHSSQHVEMKDAEA